MANEYFQILSSVDQLDQRVHYENEDSKTLISALYDQGTSFEFADIYTITVNAIDTDNNTIDLAVAGQTLNNPYNNTNITDTTANGVTYVEEIIPGLAIKFALASTLEVAQQATVRIGHRLDDGTLTAGNADDREESKARLGAKNLYGSTISNCKVKVLPKARPANVSGEAIVKVRCDSTWPSYELEDYTIRFVGYVPGSNQVCQIDGGDDVTIYCDGTTETQITTGLYVVFNEAASISSVDVSTIRVSDGHKYVQLAADDDGSPSTWVSYGATVTITEAGQAVSGTIDADAIAYFWKRIYTSDDATPTDNVREYRLVVQGDLTS